MNTEELLRDFLKVIDEIYGVYLDATAGFHANKVNMEKSQEDSINNLNLTIEHLDNCGMLYGIGDPNLPTSYILHQTTQSDYKKRNTKGGINYITLGHLCVTQLYQYWDDYYRGKIALSLGCEQKEDLLSDIFGDIRYLRISITHHRAIALSSVEKCKILTWFKEGDTIILDEKQIEQIILHVKTELDRMYNDYVLV